MKLPKWVVKWVKDEFNPEAVELKVKQQEEEIKRLKIKVAYYRFLALPEEERKGATNAYMVLNGKLFNWEWEEFCKEYLKYRDEQDVLPFE